MIPDLATLPDRLRARRGSRSLRDVADEIGIAASTLSRIERRAVPSGAHLATIEQWLAGPEPAQACNNLHAAVDAIADEYRNRLHMLVQGAESQLARDMHWEATANRQRAEIAALEQEIVSLVSDLGYAIAAMRVYREQAASMDTIQDGAEQLLAALRELERRRDVTTPVGRAVDTIAELRRDLADAQDILRER